MISVILLSMLRILLYTLIVVKHLIFGNNYNWLLNFNLIYWGRKWIVDFNARKTQLVSSGWSNNTVAIDVKMDGCLIEEKSSFKMLELNFSPKLDWGSIHYLYC